MFGRPRTWALLPNESPPPIFIIPEGRSWWRGYLGTTAGLAPSPAKFMTFCHGLPCGLLPWPFQVTFFTAFSMTFSCCSRWVQGPCACLLCLYREKAPLPSCMELWWLRFPNGFLMRPSHFLTAGADEDCSPGLWLSHLTWVKGSWFLPPSPFD